MTIQLFKTLGALPRDPIFGINALFQADSNPNKINLALGVYLDAKGKVPLLQAVKLATKTRIKNNFPHVYSPIEGNAKYNQVVKKLLFGNYESEQIITMQTLGGTGALNIGARLLHMLFPTVPVAVSHPTWENHRSIFECAGFKVVNYTYYDSSTHGIAFDEFFTCLRKLPSLSIVVLHACCHNPTGNDFNKLQWQQIISCCQERNLVPFLDMAYQGFAGGLQEDREVLDSFVNAKLFFLVANSFSKNFSLYGERVGALSIVAEDSGAAHIIWSHIKHLARITYSNPPSYGASLVTIILNDLELTDLWEQELETMRNRIETMRVGLVEQIHSLVPWHDFSFIQQQKGMFSYLGLRESQMKKLQSQYGIYALLTGRVCIAALTDNNIQYVANAIANIIGRDN